MTTFVTRVAASLRKQADYRRTVAALRDVSPAVREDLDVYPGLERAIAHRAVYGN